MRSSIFPIVVRQLLGKNVNAATNTHKNRRIVVHIVYYAGDVSRKVGDSSFPEVFVICNVGKLLC
jgi:hypothetical protein